MKKRKLLSIVLSLCMVLALMPQMVFADTVNHGSCGTNLTWSLDDNGTLTITGAGAMNDWSNSNYIPWYTDRSSIKTVVINSGVTSIGNIAFINCTSLTSVTIPNSVTSIGISAFYECTSLTSVTIPDSVKSIGTGVFGKCTSLTSVTISNGVTSIGAKTFDECTSLKSIDIPDGVTSIGEEAFRGCTNLKNVTFEKGSKLTSIAVEAFKNCTKLESIEIPGSVTSIGANAFLGCTSLDSIFLLENLNASGARISDTTSQVRYRLANDEVTITEIALGEGKTGVAIPETICGYPVVAVAAAYQDRVGSHSHKGGTATCTAKALCSICGEKYGNLLDHNLENIPAKDATLNEEGNIEYWHCLTCGRLFSDKEGINEISLEDTVIKKFTPETDGDKDQSTKADAEDSAKTGDNTNLALWLALMLISGAGITGVTVYTRRKRTNE